MDWTSLYFKTDDLKVFILGTGEVATRRAKRFLDKGSHVVLAGNSLDDELKSKGAILKDTSNISKLVEWADLVIIATGDENLADYTAKIAKNKLLNRADIPEEGNIIVPSSFKIGDIEISIFTNGKSPLMAKEIRKKIQDIISDEDIRKLELQDYARRKLKCKVKNQKERRALLYELFKSDTLTKEDIDNWVEELNDS